MDAYSVAKKSKADHVFVQRHSPDVHKSLKRSVSLNASDFVFGTGQCKKCAAQELESGLISPQDKLPLINDAERLAYTFNKFKGKKLKAVDKGSNANILPTLNARVRFYHSQAQERKSEKGHIVYSRLSLPALPTPHKTMDAARSQMSSRDAEVQTDSFLPQLKVNSVSTRAFLHAVSLMRALAVERPSWQALLKLHLSAPEKHLEGGDQEGWLPLVKNLQRHTSNVAVEASIVDSARSNKKAERGSVPAWLGHKRQVSNTPGEIAILVGRAQNRKKGQQKLTNPQPSSLEPQFSRLLRNHSEKWRTPIRKSGSSKTDFGDLNLGIPNTPDSQRGQRFNHISQPILSKSAPLPRHSVAMVTPSSMRKPHTVQNETPPKLRSKRTDGIKLMWSSNGLEKGINVTKLPAVPSRGKRPVDYEQEESREKAVYSHAFRVTPVVPPVTPVNFRSIETPPVTPTTEYTCTLPRIHSPRLSPILTESMSMTASSQGHVVDHGHDDDDENDYSDDQDEEDSVSDALHIKETDSDDSSEDPD
jgi:hypothetical protein